MSQKLFLSNTTVELRECRELGTGLPRPQQPHALCVLQLDSTVALACSALTYITEPLNSYHSLSLICPFTTTNGIWPTIEANIPLTRNEGLFKIRHLEAISILLQRCRNILVSVLRLSLWSLELQLYTVNESKFIFK